MLHGEYKVNLEGSRVRRKYVVQARDAWNLIRMLVGIQSIDFNKF